jgi:hypothetical protein
LIVCAVLRADLREHNQLDDIENQYMQRDMSEASKKSKKDQ